jgi:hypothetical protein
MSRRTLVIAALAAALTMAFAATALAGTVTGKLVSFTYSSAKTGKVVVKTGSGKKTFVITPKTACGESQGQSGGPLPCRSLKKSKYIGKKMYIRFAIKNGKKVATLVSVQL